jgi:tetratricopeptide (TPR) repeat protein
VDNKKETVTKNILVEIIVMKMKCFGFSIVIIFVLQFVGCSHTADEHLIQLFEEAQAAFDEAEKLPPEEQVQEFRRVAAQFQSIIDRGVQSGAIYYNLGNAWIHAGERGQALAAYHLAQRFLPLDPYIASNMQTALGQSSPLPSSTPIIESIFFWQNWLGCRGKVILSLVFAVTTFFAGTLSLFLRRRSLYRITLTLLGMTLLATASVGYDWYRFEWERHAIIATENAVPRKGNSEQYDPAFTSPIPFGTAARVLDERTDWLRLRFAANEDGWLPKNQVVLY